MTQQNFIFGIHAIAAILQANPEQINELYVLAERHDQKIQKLLQLAKTAGIPIQSTTRKILDDLTEGANHQGIVARLHAIKTYDEAHLAVLLEKSVQPPLILVLDGVQDPHNLGAAFRIADAAGVQAIVVPKDNAVGLTGAVIKVASGAAFTVPLIQVTNLVRALEKLKAGGLWIYGADGDAQQSLYQTDLTGPAAIVLGAEGKGLRRLTREHCDVLLKIPMTGTVESLNVSVATGIFVFEALRQRTK